MSHYVYHNISDEAKTGSVWTVSTLGYAAEAFLFVYLGQTIFSIDSESFSLSFAIYLIFAGMIARAAAVFIPIALYSLCKMCLISINLRQLVIVWYSGLIRGAIAFALSLQIKEDLAPHKKQMVSTTLMVVLITTIVLGGLMSAFAKLIGLDPESVTAPGRESINS